MADDRAAGIIFPAHKKVTEFPEVFAGGPFPRSPRVTVDAMAYARTEPYVPLYDDLVAAYNREIGSVWTGEVLGQGRRHPSQSGDGAHPPGTPSPGASETNGRP